MSPGYRIKVFRNGYNVNTVFQKRKSEVIPLLKILLALEISIAAYLATLHNIYDTLIKTCRGFEI